MTVPEKCLSTQLHCSLSDVVDNVLLSVSTWFHGQSSRTRVWTSMAVLYSSTWLILVVIDKDTSSLHCKQGSFMGNIISTVYNTESKTSCEHIENSSVSLSNPVLMELHCTWPHVCVYVHLYICLLGLTTPLYISNEHFQVFHKSMSSGVRTWCHFKVTNNVYWQHSKGKNCGYKLQKWLYGLSSNGFIVLWLSAFEFWRLAALLYMQKHLKECLPPFLRCSAYEYSYLFVRLWYMTEV